jgi:hypothetical protein
LPVAGTVLVMVLVLAGCTGHNDYYHRDPYPNGGRIDPSLASAERAMAGQLTRGDAAAILAGRTAPPWTQRMRVFLRSYAGHPTRVMRMSKGDDATAEERLLVSCPHGIAQQVGLAWGWFDGTWRAWPEYHLFPITRCGAGPPTPAAPGPAHPANKKTTTSRVRPVTANSILNPAYTVIATKPHEHCETYSQIGPADRCFADSVVYDPCWRSYQNGGGRYTGDYCLAAPWQRRVIHLTGQPPRDLPAPGGPTLWGLQLASGARCTFVIGSAGLYRGYRFNYACTQHRWLVGHPNRADPTWTITQITNTSQGPTDLRTVQIVHAWFALPNAGN